MTLPRKSDNPLAPLLGVCRTQFSWGFGSYKLYVFGNSLLALAWDNTTCSDSLGETDVDLGVMDAALGVRVRKKNHKNDKISDRNNDF